MKKLIKLFVFILMLCVVTSLLFGCNSKTNTLTVNSASFTELEAKEPDINWIRNYYYVSETNKYKGPEFELCELNGELHLNQISLPYDKAHLLCLDYKYLLGVDAGEFDGWVALCDYDSYRWEEAKQERILNELCMGFLRYPLPVGHEHDNQVALIFTSTIYLPDVDNDGRIYKITTFDEEDKEYELELYATLDYTPVAFLFDGDELIVATTQNLVSVDTSGKVTELYSSDYWDFLGVNSIVKIDDSYFIGACMGILEYKITNSEIVWYPYYNIEENIE
ncbi:MAG: hypothetical protein IJO64_01790 [Clostridia bacterium]|nr:hypothetical protein [Clostridia bacterium]